MNKFLLTITFLFVAAGVFAPLAHANFLIAKPQAPVFTKMLITTEMLVQKNGLKIEFVNTQNVKSVSYTLTYIHNNGIMEGITGSFSAPITPTVVKNFFFGTCSTKSCVFHTDVRNVVLTVDTIYTSGLTTHEVLTLKK